MPKAHSGLQGGGRNIQTAGRTRQISILPLERPAIQVSGTELNPHSRMNLFCFSLEGSMDSLYEPVENIQETSRNAEKRAGSPPCTFTSHERSYSMEKDLAANRIFSLPRQDVEMSDVNATDANKMRKRSLIQKSISENEAFDRRVGVTTHYLPSRRPDNDCYLRRHYPIEDLSEEDYMMGDRTTLVTRMKAEDTLCQMPAYEQWNPSRNQGSNGNTNEMVRMTKRLQGGYRKGSL